MQHSKAHTFFIHLAAALTLCVLAAMLLGMSAMSAHAQTPSTGGTIGGPTPQTGGTLGAPTGQTQPSGQTIANPLRYNSLNSLLDAILGALIQIGSIVLTIMLVWVGFKFVAARGNEEKIRAARTALFWTVIGGLILLGAKAIQTVITETAQNITA